MLNLTQVRPHNVGRHPVKKLAAQRYMSFTLAAVHPKLIALAVLCIVTIVTTRTYQQRTTQVKDKNEWKGRQVTTE